MTDENTQVGEIDEKKPAEEVTPPKAEPTPPAPVAVASDSGPRAAVLSANVGAEQGADIGSGTVQSSVSETSLQTDHVIQHYEDDVNDYQTLGASPSVPLPLAGADGNARKPEDVFRSQGQ